jgi:hypothetical protein
MVTNLYRIIKKNGIVVINVTELRVTYPSLSLQINEPTKFQYSFVHCQSQKCFGSYGFLDSNRRCGHVEVLMLHATQHL